MRNNGWPRVATRHFVSPGGMANLYSPSIEEFPIIDIAEPPVYVCDRWWTDDRTIIEDERPGYFESLCWNLADRLR